MYLLALELFTGVVVLGHAARRRVWVGDGGPFELDSFGELVAGLQWCRHDC